MQADPVGIIHVAACMIQLWIRRPTTIICVPPKPSLEPSLGWYFILIIDRSPQNPRFENAACRGTPHMLEPFVRDAHLLDMALSYRLEGRNDSCYDSMSTPYCKNIDNATDCI